MDGQHLIRPGALAALLVAAGVLVYGDPGRAAPDNSASPPSAQIGVPPQPGDYTTRSNDPGHANAGAGGVTEGFAFSQLDTNDDGVIDEHEAKASKSLHDDFGKVDSNHDMQISPSEFAAFEVHQVPAKDREPGAGD